MKLRGQPHRIGAMLTLKHLSRTAGTLALVLILLGTPILNAKPILKVGERFPEFQMPRSNTGELESISDHLGNKMIVHVFAGW